MRNIILFTNYTLLFGRNHPAFGIRYNKPKRDMEFHGLPPKFSNEEKFSAEIPLSFHKYSGTRYRFNPVNFLDVHRLAYCTAPTLVDGIELDYIRCFSGNNLFAVNGVLSLNNHSGFRIGEFYTERMYGYIMRTTTTTTNRGALFSRASNFSTNIGLFFSPSPVFKVETKLEIPDYGADPLLNKICLQLCSESSQLAADFYDMHTKNPCIKLLLFRSITEHFLLGSELRLDFAKPHWHITDVGLAAQYQRQSWSIAATGSRRVIDVSCWTRLHPRIQLANLWSWDNQMGNHVNTICCQCDFEDTHVRAMLDTNLLLGLEYSRYLPEVRVRFVLSLFASLFTNRISIGLKLFLDPSELQREEKNG